MNKYHKGDIVLVPFPFTDLTSKKLRPALVLSDSIPGDNVVLALITSKNSNRLPPFGVRVSKSNGEVFQKSGLKATSVIRVDNIGSFDRRIILGKLGELDKKLMKKVENHLKNIFGIC